MSSHCPISICSHQLKNSKGKEASCVMFIYTVLCNEEIRVQVHPRVDPPSSKTMIKVSCLPITSLPLLLQATQIRHAQFRLLFNLQGTSIFGGLAVSHWQEGALRTRLQTQQHQIRVSKIIKMSFCLGNMFMGGSEEI